MGTALDAAIKVFVELGWKGRRRSEATSLPLGSREQRRIAVAGLRSGDWSCWVGEGNGLRLGTTLPRGVDDALLAAFAIRCGVDARRAAALTRQVPTLRGQVLEEVVVERGAQFAARFVDQVSKEGDRLADGEPTVHAALTLRLVDTLELEIPTNTTYLRDWAIGLWRQLAPGPAMAFSRFHVEQEVPSVELLLRRHREHLLACIEQGIIGTPPVARLLPDALARGAISRDEAVEWAIQAIDRAPRPLDRKNAVAVLEELEPTSAELVARADQLLPLALTGEGPLVEGIAVPLALHAPDELLPELLLVAGAARTAKAARAVLEALSTRPAPTTAVQCAPLLAGLVGAGGRNATLAQRLANGWGIALETEPAAPEIHPWRAVPPLWSVPRFEVGEVGAERLVELGAELAARTDTEVVDLTTERFLVLLNEMARRDLALTRELLTSIEGPVPGLSALHEFKQTGTSPW